MIKKLNIKLRKSDCGGFFHDSRTDVNTLMQVCNELVKKVNELTDEVNTIKNIERQGGSLK